MSNSNIDHNLPKRNQHLFHDVSSSKFGTAAELIYAFLFVITIIKYITLTSSYDGLTYEAKIIAELAPYLLGLILARIYYVLHEIDEPIEATLKQHQLHLNQIVRRLHPITLFFERLLRVAMVILVVNFVKDIPKLPEILNWVFLKIIHYGDTLITWIGNWSLLDSLSVASKFRELKYTPSPDRFIENFYVTLLLLAVLFYIWDMLVLSSKVTTRQEFLSYCKYSENRKQKIIYKQRVIFKKTARLKFFGYKWFLRCRVRVLCYLVSPKAIERYLLFLVGFLGCCFTIWIRFPLATIALIITVTLYFCTMFHLHGVKLLKNVIQPVMTLVVYIFSPIWPHLIPWCLQVKHKLLMIVEWISKNITITKLIQSLKK